jgi:hypothetical protein
VLDYIQSCHLAGSAAAKHRQEVMSRVSKRADMPKWVGTHAHLYHGSSSAQGDIDQVKTGSPESFAQFPALKKLPMRELDILMGECPFVPQRSARIIDTSQSAGRVHKKARTSGGGEINAEGELVSQTMTPAGIFFHTGRVRCLLGIEKLRMQGLYLDPAFVRAHGFSDNLLSSLAGNAFASPCCCAATLAMLAALGSSPQSHHHFHSQ